MVQYGEERQEAVEAGKARLRCHIAINVGYKGSLYPWHEPLLQLWSINVINDDIHILDSSPVFCFEFSRAFALYAHWLN